MLLDVAEARFADEGVEAVSVRSINAAAGLAPAAVHYHFGSKQQLLAEVVDRRGVAVHAGQVAAVARLEAQGGASTTVELVEALALPFFDLVDEEPVGGRNWVRLATRLTHANDPLVTRRGRPDRLEERVQALLGRRFPRLEADFLESRWRLAILALMALVGSAGDEFSRDMVVRFTAAGFDGICEEPATMPIRVRTPRRSPVG